MQHRVIPLAVLLCATAACVPAPRAPIDLHRAETKVVRFGLKGPRSTICPGEPTKLDVIVDAVIDGDDETTRLVPHRHEINDYIFDMRQLHVTSPQGRFDEDGVFHPNPDVVGSVQTGFVLYARPPRGPAFSVRFPPSYECTDTLGGLGRPGAPGERGESGGASDTPERDKHGTIVRAAPGRLGSPGGPAGSGPRVRVYVTWVRTPDYTKLLAARSEGDIDRFVLVAPGTPLTVIARGGTGGAGGRGGSGARSTNPEIAGGTGGEGGRGGDGGEGGSIDILFDERFDDLERMIVTDVRGGDGGEGGDGGSGGNGAPGEIVYGKKNVVLRQNPGGPAGVPGPPGAKGKRGEAGSARIWRTKTREVLARFEGVGAIVPY